VYGATGAIGSAAVQLLAADGVRVTAVCGTAHTALVASLGADRVVDYQTEDVTALAERVDLLFDCWGHLSYRATRRLVAKGGTYASTGPGAHGSNLVLPLLPVRPPVRFSFPRIDHTMVQGFADLMAAGTFRPVVDRTFPLESIVDAYRYVETGQKVGNVVIDVVGS
ncbi:MAG TPA: zinc-binding dehydrogenase, partial [Acidimicrobiales bacterium]|nr:zinc-binding dehydrogenase [Acidimicrobiales bacterium]